MGAVQSVAEWLQSLFWKQEMELTLVGLQNSGFFFFLFLVFFLLLFVVIVVILIGLLLLLGSYC